MFNVYTKHCEELGASVLWQELLWSSPPPVIGIKYQNNLLFPVLFPGTEPRGDYTKNICIHTFWPFG